MVGIAADCPSFVGSVVGEIDGVAVVVVDPVVGAVDSGTGVIGIVVAVAIVRYHLNCHSDQQVM